MGTDKPAPKLALFGGYFHPAHLGHLSVVESYHKAFPKNKIIVMPSHAPPHKEAESLFSNLERIDLLRCLFDHLGYVEISDFEINQGGVSYSYKTVEYLKQRFNFSEPMHFLIGDDLVEKLHLWKKIDYLLEHALFICFRRSLTLVNTHQKIPKNKLRFIDNELHSASSTEIRKKIVANDLSGLNSSLSHKQRVKLKEILKKK